jgi:AraC-like DNA-binding protein
MRAGTGVLCSIHGRHGSFRRSGSAGRCDAVGSDFTEEATVVVLEAESADEWESVISGCFVPLRCTGFAPHFTGRMEYVRLDDGATVAAVRTRGDTADRTERLARRADRDDLHITWQRASGGVVTADGEAVSVRPGSATVYSTDRPYFLDYSRPGQHQLVIQISRSSLGLPAAMMADAVRRLLLPGPKRSVATRNFFTYADALATGAAPRRPAETMRDLAAVMIRASYGEGSGVPRTAGGLRHAVQEYFRAHATDPGLDMDVVARSHFVSRRRLYQVFDEAAQSPASLLRAERLRLAEGLLTDGRPRTIESVAYGAGFRDVTTFTRAFRRRYDCTPSEWRMRVGGDGRCDAPVEGPSRA